MARSKRGMNARNQPHNARGQFAPAPVVISIHSDDDLSSEISMRPLKRSKGEASSPSTAKKNLRGEPLIPTPAQMKPNLGCKGKKKVTMAFPLSLWL